MMNPEPPDYSENLHDNPAPVYHLQGQTQEPAYEGQGQIPIYPNEGQIPIYQGQGQTPSFHGQVPVYQVQGHAPVYEGQSLTSYPMGGAPQIVYAYQPPTVIYENYKIRQSKISGLLQILIGVALVAFNATLIGLKPNGLGPVSHGFWGGIACIITGSFGRAAAHYRTKCPVVTYMVLCIITGCLMIPVIAVGCIGIALRVEDCLNHYYSHRYCYGHSEAIIAMHVVTIALGLCEGAVAIWGSTLLCKAAGCYATNNSTVTPQAVQFIPGSGARLIIIGNPTQPNPYPGYLMNPGPTEMAPPYMSTEDLVVNTGTEKQPLTQQ